MKTLLRSDELSCPSCIRKIEKSLTAHGGVTKATVHFNTGRIEVEHDETVISPQELVEAIRAAGYASRVSTV